MDKLVYSGSGSNMTISNDGATVLKLLDIVHPAARTLVDIAKSQARSNLTPLCCMLGNECVRTRRNIV